MAGSYPDVPSRRMAWDADGTVGVHGRLTATLIELTSVQQTDLNDEDDVAYNLEAGTTGGVIFAIFPELREFDGFFGGSARGDTGPVATSGDTTNGIDGTWQDEIAVYSPATNVYANYRGTKLTTVAQSNVRAVRWEGAFDYDGSSTNYPKAMHLYGEISPGQTPDRLLWIDNVTGLEFTLPIDYGDIPRGSAEDREVQLKNNSSSLSANTVQITAEALYLNSGAWYTFKEGAGSFQSTLQLTSSIGSGSSSPVITIRRITPDSETLGLHAGRAYANVGTWT